MARQNVIAGLVAQIRATSGFGQDSGGTAVAYDHRVLAGGVDRAAIVLADRWENTQIAISGKTEIVYDLSVEVYVRHNSDVIQARQDADLYVGNILQRINSNSTLGGSAFEAVAASGQVEDEKLVVGNTPWLLESMTIKASEILSSD